MNTSRILSGLAALAITLSAGGAHARTDPAFAERISVAAKGCADDAEGRTELGAWAGPAGFVFDGKLLGYRWSNASGGLLVKRGLLGCQVIVIGGASSDVAGYVRTWATGAGYRAVASPDEGVIFSARSAAGKSLEVVSSGPRSARISFGF